MKTDVAIKSKIRKQIRPAGRALAAVLLLGAAGSGWASNGLMERALNLTESTSSNVTEWRRHIHKHPELSWQENGTSKYVADALAKMPGFEVKTGIAGTGIKAILRGGKPGPVVAIRAEMDALPVQERNDLPFKSTTKATYSGVDTYVMHACGHDTHVAMLLGAASVFSKIQKELPGTVVLLFQPAEEAGPPNGGALKMIDAGVLDNPKVDVIFGQHINASAPSGAIEYRAGSVRSGANLFNIKLDGTGGHGSSPWSANDPVIAAAEVVLSLQSIISHQINQEQGHTTMTIGMLQSGQRFNILPESAELGGTIRSMSKKNLQIVRESLQQRVKGIADAWRLKATVNIGSGGYDGVENDAAITKTLIPAFVAAAGEGKAVEGPPSMASDDFGAYGEAGIPSVLWILKASPFATRDGAPNHSPDFLIDESAMRVGVRAYVATTIQYMNSKATK